MDTFYWPVRIYYEDTDAGGIVYHSNYLKFMERARTEWLRHLGYEQDALIRDEQLIFAVRAMHIDFLRPAAFNERLRVSVAVKRGGRASVQLAQRVIPEGGDDPGEVLCEAEVRIACVDAQSLKPKPIPEPMLEVMQRV